MTAPADLQPLPAPPYTVMAVPSDYETRLQGASVLHQSDQARHLLDQSRIDQLQAQVLAAMEATDQVQQAAASTAAALEAVRANLRALINAAAP